MAKKRANADEAKAPPTAPLNIRAWELIRAAIESYLGDRARDGMAESQALEVLVPADVRSQTRAVLESYQGSRRSYRIALLGQLAYGIESETHLDLTKRYPGARDGRGVGGRVGKLLAENHIVSVGDAYQNIGKNTANMVRGNFPEFDSVLRWAAESGRTKDELRALFRYCCWHIARTARPVLSMPEINQAKLKFASVMAMFEAMLSAPSGGAHQQFIAAALLEAREEQAGTRRHVETKNINASDQSARAAADVQLKTGTKVEEAFEVTANEWSEKVDGAGQKIKAYDLSRLHIVASVSDPAALLPDLATRTDDISVLELWGFFAVLVAELRRTGRAAALRRLYELLERHQPNTELVNDYVRLLGTHGLTTTASPPAS
jgi:hypothetical protein